MGAGSFSRRRFLAGSAAVAGAALSRSPAPAAAATEALPDPRRSGIDHVVLVTMENRSFDHLLGWLPGADGRQAGLSYLDKRGVVHATHPLAPDFQGCGFNDPEHGYYASRTVYNHGRCDGWLRAGKNDDYCVGYYVQKDLPFLGAAAPAWTVCDRFFACILGPTMSNRMYLHAGRTDRTTDLPVPSGLRTIWDVLRERGMQRPLLPAELLLPLALGLETLDDHPSRSRTSCVTAARASCRRSPTSTPPTRCPSSGWHRLPPAVGHPRRRVVPLAGLQGRHLEPGLAAHAARDHVRRVGRLLRPRRRRRVHPTTTRCMRLRGFRVPTVLVSPFARRGYVDHGVYDHTSILKLIEWRWGLPALAVRDAAARNLALALDFSKRNVHAPAFTVPRVGVSPPCKR